MNIWEVLSTEAENKKISSSYLEHLGTIKVFKGASYNKTWIFSKIYIISSITTLAALLKHGGKSEKEGNIFEEKKRLTFEH